MAAHPQARRAASVAGWDAEDSPAERQDRSDERRGQGRTATPSGSARRRPRSPRSTSPAPSRRRCPSSIEPMLATLATKPFDDPDWLFEIKWDGFRVQAVVDRRQGPDPDAEPQRRRRRTSRGCSTRRRWIEADQAIVDGEVVALDEDGRPDFSLLQTKLGDKEASGLVYQAFDLLYLDGRSLLDVPARGPQAAAAERAQGPSAGSLRVACRGARGRRSSRRPSAMGVEGMVAKLRRSRYEPGRRSACLAQDQDPAGAGAGGRWLDPGERQRPRPRRAGGRGVRGRQAAVRRQGRQRLHRGRSGRTCSSASSRWSRTTRRSTRAPPKDYRGRWGGDLEDITWVRPELVIRAEIGGWTRDGQVRQTAFKGIEPDRDPTTVDRETAVTTTTAVRAAEAAEPPCRPEAGRRCHRGRATAAPSPTFAAATEEELAALDAIGKEGPWQVGGHELKLTNLDKPLFEAGPRRAADHQARAHPLLRAHRPDDAAAPPRPAAQPAALPERRRRARVLAEEHARDRRRSG